MHIPMWSTSTAISGKCRFGPSSVVCLFHFRFVSPLSATFLHLWPPYFFHFYLQFLANNWLRLGCTGCLAFDQVISDPPPAQFTPNPAGKYFSFLFLKKQTDTKCPCKCVKNRCMNSGNGLRTSVLWPPNQVLQYSATGGRINWHPWLRPNPAPPNGHNTNNDEGGAINDTSPPETPQGLFGAGTFPQEPDTLIERKVWCGVVWCGFSKSSRDTTLSVVWEVDFWQGASRQIWGR